MLLHGWMGVFGDSLASIRALSVLFTAKLAVYDWSRPKGLRLLAGILLALLPTAVRYSQEVRMYSLLGMWLIGATIALIYWVRNPDKTRYLAVYAVLMTAASTPTTSLLFASWRTGCTCCY